MVRRDDSLPNPREYKRRLTDDGLWTTALLEAGVTLTRKQKLNREKAEGRTDAADHVATPAEGGTPLEELLTDGGKR
jgi:hypothetical protein